MSLNNITMCNQTDLGNYSYFTVYFTNRQTLEFKAIFFRCYLIMKLSYAWFFKAFQQNFLR